MVEMQENQFLQEVVVLVALVQIARLASAIVALHISP